MCALIILAVHPDLQAAPLGQLEARQHAIGDLEAQVEAMAGGRDTVRRVACAEGWGYFQRWRSRPTG